MASDNFTATRRSFLIAGSAALASPLLLETVSVAAEAQPVESTTETATLTKTGKIYFISHVCVGCQTCRTLCPAHAIRYGYCGNEIEQKKCIHCGTCYRECPICAITETSY